MRTISQRHAAWQMYLPLLDAALCNRWDDVSVIVKATDNVSLRHFLLHNDLEPTLYWLIQKANASDALPAQFLLELIGSARHARRHNEQLLHLLSEVVIAAKQAEIKLITLKGLHHTDLLYGDITARRIRDIDVLVAPSQRETLEQVFLNLGFTPGPRLPLRLERYLSHARSWRRDSTEIDVHHALRVHRGFRLDTAGFIARCHEQPIYSTQALVPTESDSLVLMLLSLCDDLERGAVRARSMVDLWQLLARREASNDWSQFFAVLEKQRMLQTAQAALQVVRAGLPGAMATFPGLSDAMADVDTIDPNQAIALLAGKPLAGRRWYMHHGPLLPPTYLAWLIAGMPLRRWLNR